MSGSDVPLLPYHEWPSDQRRWTRAAHTFGYHVFQHVRGNALNDIPEYTVPEVREVAIEAIDATLYHLMELFDHVFDTPIDPEYHAEYVLLSRVKNTAGETVEVVELAPDGDGLAMGFSSWKQGNFGQEQADTNRLDSTLPSSTTVKKQEKNDYDEDEVLTEYVLTHYEHLLPGGSKTQIRRRVREELRRQLIQAYGDEIFINRCSQCQCVVRTPRAKMCFWCGHSWHE